MNVIKDISVTDSFLSLDKGTRGCQEDSYDECTTRKCRNTFINKCQCLPFQIRLNEEVSISSAAINSKFNQMYKEYCLMTACWKGDNRVSCSHKRSVPKKHRKL